MHARMHGVDKGNRRNNPSTPSGVDVHARRANVGSRVKMMPAYHLNIVLCKKSTIAFFHVESYRPAVPGQQSCLMHVTCKEINRTYHTAPAEAYHRALSNR